jgi:predicted  nucleic acid-binding Zn-ribbon protein
MGHLEQEIRDLRERMARTRYQFLQAGVQTCVLEIDMLKHELSIGNIDFAGRELRNVEKGVSTIQRLLQDTTPEQRAELEARVAELTTELEPLRIQLKSWIKADQEPETS